ncbi:MAG: sigma-70 family RNA polymerase sigma factor [Candidatus Cloacimonetes bacterium]|nr:sigma-70 family RNA polymerase sigma factor [Candidatus Cloacimonadota bacterium]
MTDRELILEYSNGNLDAFHKFYDRHKDSLYTFLLNMGRESADDLFQETFIKFIDAASRREIENPGAYLFRIALNLLRNSSRHEKTILLEPDYDVPDEEIEVEKEPPVSEAELKNSLVKLAKEKPDFYDVLHLHIFEKMTFAQISSLKEKSRDTIASRYRYAIHHLRKMLQPGLKLVKEV